MTVRDLLTERPQTKRRLAQRVYDCHCPGSTCTHVRDIEEEVRALILKGAWIVSDGRGYRTTTSIEEIERYVLSLEHRRDSLNERIGALRRAVRGVGVPIVVQESLWAAQEAA